MTYKTPKQNRAIKTEQAFLASFAELLLTQSYAETTVVDIAQKANKTQSAFMARFGSKRHALEQLFELFCQDIYRAIDQAREDIKDSQSPEAGLMTLSLRYEELVKQHLGANRAMAELFMLDGKISPQTKGIFMATVDLFQTFFIQQLGPDHAIEKSYASTQLLITLNYYHALGAMPAMPPNREERHRLIVNCIKAAAQS